MGFTGRHYYLVGVHMEGPTHQTSASERTPFVGLTLGLMLGKGSYGRVYKGYWHGRVVAVKARTLLLIELCRGNLKFRRPSSTITIPSPQR